MKKQIEKPRYFSALKIQDTENTVKAREAGK